MTSVTYERGIRTKDSSSRRLRTVRVMTYVATETLAHRLKHGAVSAEKGHNSYVFVWWKKSS
jgi:hypothetical protein